MPLAIGLLIPLMGTMLGSAFVFLMKDEMSPRVRKTLLGFASGVMVAASVWSLLMPAMEMEADSGRWSVVPAAVGFLLGMGFLLALDELTPHLHVGSDTPEGPRSRLSRTARALSFTRHLLWHRFCHPTKSYSFVYQRFAIGTRPHQPIPNGMGWHMAVRYMFPPTEPSLIGRTLC